MAIIENRVTEEGDVLIIKPEVPIVGLISLDQFVTNTLGETETDYFLKEFRYSVDGGLTFSGWLELNLTNIQSVSITAYNQFVIEYKFTRVGIAPEVDLEFNDILVSGESTELPFPIYQKTFFNDFFNVNDINVFGWALNVLEKLYIKGQILPDYIQRADNNSNLEDEDFIVFWNTITHFFAIIVYMARNFENIQDNIDLTLAFLESRGVYFSSALDSEGLYNIFFNWVDEYSKRGTSSIYRLQSDGYTLDGELIRLLTITENKELIAVNLSNFETGWCVGKSSPTWKRTDFSVNLKKVYTDLVLSSFPLINSANVSLGLDGGEDVIEIDSTVLSGIGYNSTVEKYCTISDNYDYEITFLIKLLNPSSQLNCSISLFDAANNPISSNKVVDGSSSSSFITGFTSNNNSFYYYVRLIVFNKSKLIDAESLNSFEESNLRFGSGAVKLIPNILVNGQAYIKDISVKPYNYEFSQGQLGMRNVFMLVSENNSQYTDEKVDNFILDNLIPYDNFLKSRYL